MKVIAVNGITKSGKTTVCEALISGLTARGFTVGSVKEIHFELFKMDTDGKNTQRHRNAGASLVTARGLYETDVLYPCKLPITRILSHYNQDFVVLEGVTDANVARIVTAHTQQDALDSIDARTIAVSGQLANTGIREVCGLPVINALTEPERLLALVLEKAFVPLPDFDPKCCSLCGHSCRELAGLIAAWEANANACVLNAQDVELAVNGRQITMVPFVQRLLKNAVMAIVSELDGADKNAQIVVTIKDER